MPFNRVMLPAAMRASVDAHPWFASNYRAHVVSNLDDGAHRFEYDVLVRDSRQYRSGNITGDSDFPPFLISDTLTNRSVLLDDRGECSVWFFDGIPFDGSPWDGILQLFQAEAETEGGIFRASGGALHRGVEVEVYDLRQPFSSSSLSTYWEAAIFMTLDAPPRMLHASVKGSGMDGANHSLTEDYYEWSHEAPDAKSFAVPEQCGACLNCDGVSAGRDALV